MLIRNTVWQPSHHLPQLHDLDLVSRKTSLWHARAGDQYRSLHELLGEFTAYSTRAPYAASRPSGRPKSAASARAWWQYAGRVVRSQLKHSLSWDEMSQVSAIYPAHGF